MKCNKSHCLHDLSQVATRFPGGSGCRQVHRQFVMLYNFCRAFRNALQATHLETVSLVAGGLRRTGHVEIVRLLCPGCDSSEVKLEPALRVPFPAGTTYLLISQTTRKPAKTYSRNAAVR